MQEHVLSCGKPLSESPDQLTRCLISCSGPLSVNSLICILQDVTCTSDARWCSPQGRIVAEMTSCSICVVCSHSAGSMVGAGSFGRVYHGIMAGEQEVAIKVINHSGQTAKQVYP